MPALCHPSQKLEVEAIALHFRSNVPNDSHFRNIQLLPHQIVAHEDLIQSLELFNSQHSLVEVDFPGKFVQNILLHVFLQLLHILLTVLFLLGLNGTALPDKRRQLAALPQSPQKLDVFDLDMWDHNVIVIL